MKWKRSYIKKKLQEEDVENDEEKKNENKQCEISATKDKLIQKELHETDTTKNKKFEKKVDDFEDGRWPKNNLRIIYFDTHEINKVFFIVVLTSVAVLSMKEHVVNVTEPLWMDIAPPLCSKMKERPKKETEEL